MNLHSEALRAITAVNPNQPMLWMASTGYTVNPDGTRTPTYAFPVRIWGQAQELTTRDLRQLEALNIQGSHRSIYFNGAVNAAIRVTQQGGDLITMRDGSIWLTTQCLEIWGPPDRPEWCKVSVVLQDGA